MKQFKGFQNAEQFTSIPDAFFRQVLPEIRELDELKVTAYALWRLANIEGPFKALAKKDIEAGQAGLKKEEIVSGLEKAAARGTLIKAENKGKAFYFLNSPQGRAAAKAFAKGGLSEAAGRNAEPPIERPSIFRLYEENIGALTPLIADALKDAEETFSAEWVAEAIDLAVKNNKRNWRYCEAILKRWKEEGRAEKQNRRDAEEDRHKYIKGEFADYIEH